MIHFDSTVTAGSLISAAIILAVGIAGWVAFRARVDTLLDNQDRLMAHLTQRFEGHEDRDAEMFDKVQSRLSDLAAGIQRLVGQNEAFRITHERRKP